jgi:Flp pilus assembly protein TadD
VLRSALEMDPEAGEVHHAIGLLLIRTGRLDESIDELGLAAVLTPGNPRYGYVFAVALAEVGRHDEAINVLERVAARSPGNADTLVALVTMNRDAGAIDAARIWGQRLLAVRGDDPAVQALVESLR